MSQFGKRISSSVGQKFLLALTGLGLVGFVVLHLLGNLTLFAPSPDVFNEYAHRLESLGRLVYVAEVGLGLLFLVHIVTAIKTVLRNRAARPNRYEMSQSKKGPSKAGVASSYMAIWGLILLVFLVVHLYQFRVQKLFAGYSTTIHGESATDLHRLVSETFQNPLWTAFYVGAMIVLGFHLRHGFWSAFQSLGVLQPKWSGQLRIVAWLLAFLIATGFLLIPVALYFGVPASFASSFQLGGNP